MIVLGIETSCDETAAAVVARVPGRRGLAVRSDVVASQAALHARTGGVVPEVASREHLATVIPTVRAALAQAGVRLAALDAIAVTQGPGLVGALLVGVETGKAFAYATGVPLVPVHHLAGHLAAALLPERAEDPDPPGPHGEPHVALLVSGGHTTLLHVDRAGGLSLLGATRDDAAGEAYDKVGKLLGLGYPAGPAIDRLAATGDARAVAFPRALPGRDDLSFSFSGLKTAAATLLEREGAVAPPGAGPVLPAARLADLCASFQAAVVDVLARKARAALRRTGARWLVVAGGVAANRGLRAALRAAAEEDGFALCIPPVRYCTDNAAMIAAAGLLRRERGGIDPRWALELDAEPGLPLAASVPGGVRA